MNRVIRLMFVLAVFLLACALPAAAGDQTWAVSSFFDIWYESPGATGAWVQVPVNASGPAITLTHPPEPGVSDRFDTELLSLDLRETPVVPGDPDFDLLRIRAGSDFGLPPSTGQSHPPDPGSPVDSFFDVFFDIELVGGTHLSNQQAAHFFGVANSYVLAGDVQLYGGHPTVLKSGSTLNMTPAVPEPSSLALGASGLFAGLLALRRRER